MENTIARISHPVIPSLRRGIMDILRMFVSALTAGSHANIRREEQFNTILNEYGGIISGICFAYSNNSEDLKDLRQDILLNIWKGLSNYKGESALTTWLYRVALNTCVSTIRKRKGHLPTIDLERAGEVAEETDVVRQERLGRLHQMISGLSPVDKAIITMWLDERGYDEIAAVIGLSRNNVAVRINRIKKKLASNFDEE